MGLAPSTSDVIEFKTKNPAAVSVAMVHNAIALTNTGSGSGPTDPQSFSFSFGGFNHLFFDLHN